MWKCTWRPVKDKKWLQLWRWHSKSKTTPNSQLQFQWLPHNVIGWNLHNPHPPNPASFSLSHPSPFDLINLLLTPPPLRFYKTCTFMRPRNGIVCTKTSQDGRSITRVNTFQKRLLIGDVCMQIDMAQQDVSYSTLVKQCKHKAAVCDEEETGMLMKSQAALLHQLAKMQSWLSHL